METPNLRIELLGEPRLLIDGEEVRIPRMRVRALAFYLAAEGRSIPRATLAWLLWPDCAADVASRNLSIHLSYLRSALPDGSLVPSRSAAAFAASELSTDIADFERLSTSELEEDAIGAAMLFRGPFLEGFSLKDAHPFDQWSDAQQTRWAARFANVACRAACILARREETDRALELLEAADRATPLNEDVYRHRMRIMAQGGKRAHVGALYQDLVSRLNESLGIPPSHETVMCYQEIIGSNDGFTALVRDSGQQFVGSEDDMPFIGRESQVRHTLEDSTHRLILVQGQAGIGKTRFLSEFAKTDKSLPVIAPLSQQGKNVPFSAIAAIVRAMRSMPDWSRIANDAEGRMPSDLWATLCCLVPELHPCSKSPSPSFAFTAIQVTEATACLVEEISRHHVARILIDDLHNSDASSLAVLQSVLAKSNPSAVQIIATLSPALMDQSVATFLNELQKANFMRVVRLDRLDDNQMTEILLFYFPDIDGITARNLVALADGNPYWMKAIVTGLDSGYTEFSGKNSLESLFDFTLRSLSPEAQAISEKLAVMEEPCEFRLFARLCRSGTPENLLLELSTAGITALDCTNHVQFLHKQMRNHILSRLTREPRRFSTAHLRVAQGMEELYGDGPAGTQDIAIARHYLKSTRPEACARFAAKAGDYLLQVSDIQGAIQYFKLAVRHLDGAEKLDCTLILYINMTHRGRFYEADLYMQEAISVARSQGRQDYVLAFEAARNLVDIPEFKEVQAGVIPCYRRNINTRIDAMLAEAEQEAYAHGASMLLSNYILAFRSSYHLIRGNFEKSKDCLNRLVGRNLWQRGRSDSSTNMLLQYSALITLIAIMNWHPDERIYNVIRLEEEMFRETPINSFSALASGVNALLTNIRGDYAEGERLMDIAIAELRKLDNPISLANTLVTQAMLVHAHAPGKAYAANLEAYQIAQECQAQYTLVRSLIGLVITSPDKREAVTFLEELRELAGTIGDDMLYTRIARAASKLNMKS